MVSVIGFRSKPMTFAQVNCSIPARTHSGVPWSTTRLRLPSKSFNPGKNQSKPENKNFSNQIQTLGQCTKWSRTTFKHHEYYLKHQATRNTEKYRENTKNTLKSFPHLILRQPHLYLIFRKNEFYNTLFLLISFLYFFSLPLSLYLIPHRHSHSTVPCGKFPIYENI